MSPRTAINSEKGLQSPLFSQAIVCNGMVYVSGNIGMDYGKMELIEGTVADRTVWKETAARFLPLVFANLTPQRQALLNIQTVLEEAGSSLQNMAKV